VHTSLLESMLSDGGEVCVADLYYAGCVCVCVSLVAEIDTLIFRNADIPKVSGSDYRSAEMPICHFGFPRCRYLAFQVFNLGNKGMSLSC